MRTIRLMMVAVTAAVSFEAALAADDTTAPQADKNPPQEAAVPAQEPAVPDKKPQESAPQDKTPDVATSVPTPPSVTVIDAVDAHGILGRDVRSAAGENMGRIADVIVDRGGQTRAAVIDFGGFLGVGSRRIVVDWNALQFAQVANKSESISLGLTRDQVRAAPEYKDDQPIVVLGASGNLEPLRFPPLPMREK